MTSKESLENIVINFDSMGMICSNLCYEEFYCKDLHFKEIFKTEYESILRDLERLEKLEKELKQTKSNFKNSQTHSKTHYKRLIDKYLKLETENTKLKKVIEILEKQNEGQTISQEDNDLLKEFYG